MLAAGNLSHHAKRIPLSLCPPRPRTEGPGYRQAGRLTRSAPYRFRLVESVQPSDLGFGQYLLSSRHDDVSRRTGPTPHPVRLREVSQ